MSLTDEQLVELFQNICLNSGTEETPVTALALVFRTEIYDTVRPWGNAFLVGLENLKIKGGSNWTAIQETNKDNLIYLLKGLRDAENIITEMISRSR